MHILRPSFENQEHAKLLLDRVIPEHSGHFSGTSTVTNGTDHANEFYLERESNQKLSGNEVYYTNSLILLVENVLCSKLHCQKGLNLILFSYKIHYATRTCRHPTPLFTLSHCHPYRTGYLKSSRIPTRYTYKIGFRVTVFR